MKLHWLLPLFLVCALLPARAASPQRLKATPAFEAIIDDLCLYTGLLRAGPIQRVERWDDKAMGRFYRVDVPLQIDGSTGTFSVILDSHHQPSTFFAEHPDFSHIRGLGFNAVTSPLVRCFCVNAVGTFAFHYHWMCYGRGAIQRLGHNYLMTYQTVSEAEQKKSGYAYLDPYVSFIITPRGTIIATVFGA